MSIQIAVRIPSDLADGLDGLVASGRFDSRAEAIRTAIETLVDTERRRRIGEAIVEGYRRIPDGDDPDLDAAIDAAGHEILKDLEADEAAMGFSWEDVQW
jgi:Arc/MetJ-type ribon-helix-helix transcriptional regulator